MHTYDEFREFIRATPTEAICSNYIFGPDPWLFQAESDFRPTVSYAEFRAIVAAGVGVAPGDVFISGSSVFGRSTNPTAGRFNREFSEESDLDVVIVSEPLFRSSWDQLRLAFYRGYGEILAYHSKNVFRGFVAEPDRDFGSTQLRGLIKRTITMKSDVQKKAGTTQELKYRIYQTFQNAFEYHAFGIDKCKKLVAP